MKATITDIAKATGLSVSTVSKYLNQKSVLPENRKKIQEAIKQLDYTPNRMAQNLRSQNTQTIALILPPMEHSLYGKLVNPIENKLKSMSYLSFVCTNIPGSSSEHSLLDYLFINHITGILSVSHSLSSHALQKIQQKRIPCTCVDNLPTAFSGDVISADHYRDGRHAASLFLETGHHKIALIGKPLNTYASIMRNKGIQDVLSPSSSRCTLLWKEISSLSEASMALEEILASSVTGVICLDHLSSLGVLSSVINQRITIPKELSLFCFDYEPLFEALVPNLCSMNESYEELGKKSASLLLERISNPEKKPEQISVSSVFYQGTTILPFLDEAHKKEAVLSGNR